MANVNLGLRGGGLIQRVILLKMANIIFKKEANSVKIAHRNIKKHASYKSTEWRSLPSSLRLAVALDGQGSGHAAGAAENLATEISGCGKGLRLRLGLR